MKFVAVMLVVASVSVSVYARDAKILTAQSLTRAFRPDDPFEVGRAFLLHPKSEMETSAEYAKRLAAEVGEYFAFQVPEAKITYDADTESVSVAIDSDKHFTVKASLAMDSYKYFTVKASRTRLSEYIGQNALGVKMRVATYSGLQANVMWPDDANAGNLLFEIPMSRAQAATQKPRLRAIVTLRLGPGGVTTRRYHIHPEIDRPIDVMTKYFEFHGDPIQICVYDFETGEILLRRFIRGGGDTASSPLVRAPVVVPVDWRSAIKEVGSGKVATLGTAGAAGGDKSLALSFETPWHDWTEFAEDMSTRIRASWYSNMPHLIETGLKGVVTIRFTIHRDGSITDATILASSGVPPYDFAAKKGIEISSPLNPLPKDFPNETERVTAVFKFNPSVR